MNVRQSEAWQRHQLAAIERTQADIARYTRPIVNITGTCSLFYLMTWGPLCAFWAAGDMPWLPVIAVAVSGVVIALSFPAFALALGIEQYFCHRLRTLQSTIAANTSLSD